MNKPRVVSLAAGCGVGQLGLSQTMQTVLAADSWWRACCSHRANHPGVPVVWADIANERFISQAKEHLGTIDGILSTPACQPFSVAWRCNPNDARAKAFLCTTVWAAVFKPKFILVENVPGLANAASLRE